MYLIIHVSLIAFVDMKSFYASYSECVRPRAQPLDDFPAS